MRAKLSNLQSIPQVVAEMTLDEKLDMVGCYRACHTRPIPDMDVPAIYLVDGATGLNGTHVVLDYLTGVIKAVYTKNVSSEVGFKGLIKKITILIIVALSNVLQQITGDNVAIREIVIMFYIANEGISVLENVAVIYPRMPQKLKDILLQLRGEDDTEE